MTTHFKDPHYKYGQGYDFLNLKPTQYKNVPIGNGICMKVTSPHMIERNSKSTI